ncbi:MAG TPA: glycosyl hydrolase 115 family protein [Phycisphaerae bacterium]|nr:glycosyl hydrolase 115 family protein [Phycisphaerae bacterium]
MMRRMIGVLAVLLLVRMSAAAGIDPLAPTPYVETVAGAGDFPLVANGKAATLIVDAQDWPGVVRAAGDLQADVKRVTGRDALLVNKVEGASEDVVIIGTAGKSAPLDALAKAGKIDLKPLAGKWESFFIQVVADPMPGVSSALVIAGSDKRGTIYGIYDVSENIGVSPWYWWADVTPRHQDSLYVKPGIYRQGEPSVKYRGIFINDEAPDLTNWVKEKYGTVAGMPNVANYNHEFYAHVFELILRLKGNYLWPAMWNNAFNEDDPENPKLADEYGIVMGTSHQEPMLRAQKEWDRRHRQSWNYYTDAATLQEFWKEGVVRNKDYESILTIGLRGANDTPMIPGGTREQSMALLQQIITAQRKIIAETLNPDPAKVPQLWCPYKEVLDYYNAGFRVPDDVTILWTDDNWGNIRRLPTVEERGRAGGAGIYYHFDYVGGPRNYKWLNTNPLPKIWEEMTRAKAYGADRIWIVNVGHLKGLELPLDYFMHLAWDGGAWTNENIDDFTRRWAEREFGAEYAGEIADILTKETQYNGRRKPEFLEPGTYSLVNYDEADRVVADFDSLEKRAEAVYAKLPAEERDAFYEIVLFPVKACAQVNALYVAAGKNALYAQQGRASANDWAAKTRALFQADAELMDEYNHKLGGGRWDHFMDQVHIGYRSWQDPPRNVMPAVREIQLPAEASLGVAVEGSADAWPKDEGAGPALARMDVLNKQRRWVDVFNRGRGEFAFTATGSAPWITVSPAQGTVTEETQVMVGVDWSKAPAGVTSGEVRISGAGKNVAVKVEAFRPRELTPENLEEFVDGDGAVSMEAADFTKNVPGGSAKWAKIEDYGRTGAGMTILPVTAASVTPGQGGPCLEYKMYLFDGGNETLHAMMGPTLNVDPERGVRVAFSWDGDSPEIVDVVPKGYNAQNGNRDWEKVVKDNCREVVWQHAVGAAGAGSGYHTLKVWMVDPGVVVEKLVVDCGGMKASYLGPPESFRRP